MFLAGKRVAREHRDRPAAGASRDNRRDAPGREAWLFLLFPGEEKSPFFTIRTGQRSRVVISLLHFRRGPLVPRMSAYEKEIRSVTKFENFSLCQETISFCLSPRLSSSSSVRGASRKSTESDRIW